MSGALNRDITRNLAKVLFVAALLTPALSATASCNKDPDCDDISDWSEFTHISLSQSVSGSSETIKWVGSFDHKTLDASIDIITSGSKEQKTATVALVGGQVMITKGMTLKPGYEIDALDAPVLSMRLAMIVLKRLFPKGPDEIVGTVSVDQTEQTGIKYATPSASGYIPAPWHVKGKVSRLIDGKVPFDIVLSVPIEQRDGQKKKVTINMKGEFSVLGHPVFSDSDSLDGWTTYGVGPQQITQGNSTILDYGAKPDKASSYRTIGDIRAFIAAENSPGTKDDSRDFSGFWKEKCDDPYGLQIKHYGANGEYSLVFCGPGGCGDPSQSRLTFITGDKRYNVISENELIRISRSGDRSTYYRCTKDTDPDLKYRQ